jgi:N-acetylmuramoyl-L-alanine amidase
MKICLDPGHGGSDPGAVNGTRYEKDDVLQLALAAKPLLEAQGVDVILTRDADKSISIIDRCALANKNGCDYFLSIHRDAASASAYGISTWVHSKANSSTVGKAKSIHDSVLAVAPTYNRNVNKGTPQSYDDFGVNVNTTMASALIEMGFITNADDNKRFDEHFSQYAQAIAKGLCDALGVAYKKPEKPTGMIYRVQVGAFSIKENAERYAEDLRSKGYSTIIKAEKVGE